MISEQLGDAVNFLILHIMQPKWMIGHITVIITW